MGAKLEGTKAVSKQNTCKMYWHKHGSCKESGAALYAQAIRSICSDEGLTLETLAFQSLYGGQFTLSTLLINQIFALGTLLTSNRLVFINLA